MPLAVCLGVLKDDGIFSSTPAVGAFRANPMWDVRWMTKIAAALPYLKDMQWTVDMVATDHWWRRDIPMTSTEPEFCGVLRSLDVSRLQSLDIDLPGALRRDPPRYPYTEPTVLINRALRHVSTRLRSLSVSGKFVLTPDLFWPGMSLAVDYNGSKLKTEPMDEPPHWPHLRRLRIHGRMDRHICGLREHPGSNEHLTAFNLKCEALVWKHVAQSRNHSDRGDAVPRDEITGLMLSMSRAVVHMPRLTELAVTASVDRSHRSVTWDSWGPFWLGSVRYTRGMATDKSVAHQGPFAGCLVENGHEPHQEVVDNWHKLKQAVFLGDGTWREG